MKKTLFSFGIFAALVLSASAGSDVVKNRAGSRDITLEEAVAIALRDNPDIRKAKAEIERTRGLVIEVRAQALPQVSITSAYDQTDPRLLQTGGGSGGTITIPTTNGSGTTTGGTTTIVTGGNSVTGDKSWNVILQGKQVIYSGGQVAAATRIAKLTEDTSLYGLRTTIDQVISDVRKNFYLVLLNRALITVQQESLQLLESELKDQQNRFDAGTVPRFNVLRAEVEVANQRPAVIQARNAYLIAELQLAKLLGMDYEPSRAGEPPVNPVGALAVHDRSVVLNDALMMAKMRRTFLKAQRQNILVEVQQIKV
ncbi:MAG: TolC family protein, partial [Verrucomicrobiota bacterium]|nr:TolC family protein [Verrucomicrobiota bacterium]